MCIRDRYKVPAENILYIHGKALSSKKLVVGHHDISTFQYGAVSPFNAAEEHGIYIQDDDEDFRITETKEIIKAYFQKTYKDTFGIIQMNQNFFDSLININEIFILGHSLSSVAVSYTHLDCTLCNSSCKRSSLIIHLQ